MAHCVICGDQTTRPLAAVVWHFRPFAWHPLPYVWGNCQTFGFWSGMKANLTLYFSFVNTLWHWKYRKMRLEIR